jgi:hypothetical protein
MLSAPGNNPSATLEQRLDLEVTRRVCTALSHKDATELAVKLRRENQLLRAAVLELSDELDRITRGK